MTRLIAGVAENPLFGVGIDENAALVRQRGAFAVLGSGAVYVLDGSELSATSVAEAGRKRAMSAFDLRLHVLGAGDGFAVAARRSRRGQGASNRDDSRFRPRAPRATSSESSTDNRPCG